MSKAILFEEQDNIEQTMFRTWLITKVVDGHRNAYSIFKGYFNEPFMHWILKGKPQKWLRPFSLINFALNLSAHSSSEIVSKMFPKLYMSR